MVVKEVQQKLLSSLRKSEDKCVELFERWLLFKHVFHEGVDLLACNPDLVIERLLLSALFLELDEFVLLVEHRLDSALFDHFGDEVLGLLWLDSQEVAQL